MKRIEYKNVVDKSRYIQGPYPWFLEPDKVQYQDETTGLPCLIVRGPWGFLCGYVGVSKGHPSFGKKYHNVDSKFDIDVHGGLTYSDHCQPGPENKSICHKVESDEDDNVWWLGFDCGHALDISPGIPEDMRVLQDPHREYRDLAYVEGEVKKLARQLYEIQLNQMIKKGSVI